jgi:hypothetical protein
MNNISYSLYFLWNKKKTARIYCSQRRVTFSSFLTVYIINMWATKAFEGYKFQNFDQISSQLFERANFWQCKKIFVFMKFQMMNLQLFSISRTLKSR